MKNTLYIILLFSLVSCGTGKFATSYKLEKKSTDSLIILQPLVQIDMVDEMNNKEKDNKLIENNKKLISDITYGLLDSKYILFDQGIADYNTDLIFNLCDHLENSENTLSGHYILDLDFSNEFKTGPKYALLIVYKGMFNPNFEPDYNIKAGMTTNTLIINSSTKPYSDLRLLIINRENNEVVFYSSNKTTNSDPRVQAEIEQMTKLILKPIYYK